MSTPKAAGSALWWPLARWGDLGNAKAATPPNRHSVPGALRSALRPRPLPANELFPGSFYGCSCHRRQRRWEVKARFRSMHYQNTSIFKLQIKRTDEFNSPFTISKATIFPRRRIWESIIGNTLGRLPDTNDNKIKDAKSPLWSW